MTIFLSLKSAIVVAGLTGFAMVMRWGAKALSVKALSVKALSVKALGVRPAGATIGRLLCVVALGTLLAGCDRCGDWWWASEQSQSCKGKLPPQPRALSVGGN